ncbi:UNVERIFIED_CONTAM: hypothetical protein FKN15_004868 [Acipenser sinensis]
MRRVEPNKAGNGSLRAVFQPGDPAMLFIQGNSDLYPSCVATECQNKSNKTE